MFIWFYAISSEPSLSQPNQFWPRNFWERSRLPSTAAHAEGPEPWSPKPGHLPAYLCIPPPIYQYLRRSISLCTDLSISPPLPGPYKLESWPEGPEPRSPKPGNPGCALRLVRCPLCRHLILDNRVVSSRGFPGNTNLDPTSQRYRIRISSRLVVSLKLDPTSWSPDPQVCVNYPFRKISAQI